MTARHPYGSGRSRLDDLLNSMDSHELREVIILNKDENDTFEASSLNKFHHSDWQGIDWDASDFLDQEYVSGEKEAAGLLRAWLSRYTSPNALLVIFWGNAIVPTVALPIKNAVKHAEEVLYTSSEVWMFAADEGILVEYTHDGRLTLGRVPSTN